MAETPVTTAATAAATPYSTGSFSDGRASMGL